MRSLALALLLTLTSGAARAAQTVVTLGFDDGSADHVLARQLLDARGLKGTFYINSAQLGSSSWYMTRADVQGIFDAGHEIAGHTLNHLHLTTLSQSQMQTEICDDRQNLISWGYNPVSFAYPFGEQNATVVNVTKSCGYDNARIVGGITCSGCPKTETLPPQDRFLIRSPDSVKSDTTLAQMQKWVTDAEQSGGGFLPLVFHHVCDACDTYSVSAATLGSFLDWLKLRESQGTIVRTNAQALGIVSSPPPPPPPPPPPSSSTTTYSIWRPNQVPGSGQSSTDATSLELGLRFRADVDGEIRGLRFHKRSGATGSHTGHLWTNTGTLLGSLTFTNETASGWQTASFSAPIPIRAGVTYMASYHAAGGYSVTTNAFATAGVDAPPLHALRSGVDGVNGTYVASTSPAFPNRTNLASNYWVDVVFAVAGSSSTTPPPPPPADNPVPAISALTPSSAPAGGAAFTLTVDGSGFVSSSTVRWNGGARATTFVSASRLTAAIASADIAAAGSVPVTVFNPAPGGGTSNSMSFVVTSTTTAPPPPPPPPPSGALFSQDFSGPNALITNEYAFFNASDPASVVSSTWIVNAGSFFVNNGTGWTGVPDNVDPNAASSNGTGSAVFRARTRRADFGDVTVTLSLTNAGFVTTPTTPAQAYDAVHLGLRYASESSYYDFSLNRRDNTVVLKKKVGTALTQLASAAYAAPIGSAQSVSAGAVNRSDGAVGLTLSIGGRQLINVADAGTGGAPIRAAGALNLRGDNANFRVDDIVVSAAASASTLGALVLKDDAAPAAAASPAAVTGLEAARVFPNPWRADRDGGTGVTIDNVPAGSSIRIYTNSGRFVRALEAPAGSARWDLSGEGSVGAGVYLYLIDDGRGGRKRGALGVLK